MTTKQDLREKTDVLNTLLSTNTYEIYYAYGKCCLSIVYAGTTQKPLCKLGTKGETMRYINAYMDGIEAIRNATIHHHFTALNLN